MKKFHHKLNQERGQFLVLLALIAVILLLLVGLSIDAGRLYLQWSGLTRALDAACASAIRQAPGLEDAEIQNIVSEVAGYNMQKQGANLANLAVNTVVSHNPNLASLIKLRITGTLSNYPTVLMKLIPGQNFSNIQAQSTCPICYDNPQCFSVPGPSYYEGGLECQQACNDGAFVLPGTTESCCPFLHSWQPGNLTSNCICASSVNMAALTDSCNPGDPQGNPVILNPMSIALTFTPQGISQASQTVWLARPLENDLMNACVMGCVNQGFETGNLWCNEGCGDADDTACCKCHCSEPCESNGGCA